MNTITFTLSSKSSSLMSVLIDAMNVRCFVTVSYKKVNTLRAEVIFFLVKSCLNVKVFRSVNEMAKILCNQPIRRLLIIYNFL